MGEGVTPGLKVLLNEGKLRRARITRETVLKEFEGASKDLETARKSLKEDDYKWATIQAYYSIFHAARGLIYNRGFREKSHRGLLAAIRILYSKEPSAGNMEDFSEAMRLREEPDYGLVYSEESAIDVVESAEIFLGKCKAIIGLTSSKTKSRKTHKTRSRELIAERRKIPKSMFGSNPRLRRFTAKDEAEFHDLFGKYKFKNLRSLKEELRKDWH